MVRHVHIVTSAGRRLPEEILPERGGKACAVVRRDRQVLSLQPSEHFSSLSEVALKQKCSFTITPQLGRRKQRKRRKPKAYDRHEGKKKQHVILHSFEETLSCLKCGKILAVLRCELPQTVEQLLGLKRHGDVVAVAEVARPHVGLREHRLSEQGPARLAAS